MNARDAIEAAAEANGWTVWYVGADSYGAGTSTWKRGGEVLDVTFSISGTVTGALHTDDAHGYREITGTGKREAVLAVVESPVAEAESDAEASEDGPATVTLAGLPIGARVRTDDGRTGTVVSGTVWTWNLNNEGRDMLDRGVAVDGTGEVLRWEGHFLTRIDDAVTLTRYVSRYTSADIEGGYSASEVTESAWTYNRDEYMPGMLLQDVFGTLDGCEASDSQWTARTWYTADVEMYDGDVYTASYHLDGLTVAESRELFGLITREPVTIIPARSLSVRGPWNRRRKAA